MKKPHWRPAYIGVGSNLDSPVEQVERATAALDKISRSRLIVHSHLYQSAPMGRTDQPDFVNAVAAMLTQLGPHELLLELQSIEHTSGRIRDGERWGPRIIDLDLLSFAGVTLSADNLTLPHPGIVERNFVLLPWCEIAPNYKVPGLASVATLASSMGVNMPKLEMLTKNNK